MAQRLVTLSPRRHDSMRALLNTHVEESPLFDTRMWVGIVWHDSSICATWLIHICDMTHFMCAAWHNLTCDVTHPYVRHGSMRASLCLQYGWVMTHFMCAAWHNLTCDVTHPYVRHDSMRASLCLHVEAFLHVHLRWKCVTWLLHMWHVLTLGGLRSIDTMENLHSLTRACELE